MVLTKVRSCRPRSARMVRSPVLVLSRDACDPHGGPAGRRVWWYSVSLRPTSRPYHACGVRDTVRESVFCILSTSGAYRIRHLRRRGATRFRTGRRHFHTSQSVRGADPSCRNFQSPPNPPMAVISKPLHPSMGRLLLIKLKNPLIRFHESA